MDRKYYFWFSKEQDSLVRKIDPRYSRTFCKLADGKIVEYSECASYKKKSGWNDAVFLGTGEYDHSEEK